MDLVAEDPLGDHVRHDAVFCHLGVMVDQRNNQDDLLARQRQRGDTGGRTQGGGATIGTASGINGGDENQTGID